MRDAALCTPILGLAVATPPRSLNSGASMRPNQSPPIYWCCSHHSARTGSAQPLPFRPRWPIGSQKPGARPVAAIVNRSAAEKGAFQYSAAYERQRYPLGEFPEGKG